MPNVSVPIAIQRRAEIIERLAEGELVQAIANDMGIHRMTISTHLCDDPEYQLALLHSLDSRLETRELELERADEQLSVARADKLLSHARWRAERLNSGKYGQMPKTAVQVNTTVSTVVEAARPTLTRAEWLQSHGIITEGE